ncbi:MAG TPA: TonB-dependent receptor [Steroidobacteraceae bacterium]|nr:TonB-dependent receptor [Steroidobacteraceae bacterium]
MRVNVKTASRRGAYPVRQRAIGSTHKLAGVGPSSVAAVVAGILGASGLAVTGSALAQDAQSSQTAQSASASPQNAPTLAPAPTGQSIQSLQTVVVTATATAVRKLDASYNIVAASAQQIAMSDPSSAAAIYKLSPGIWPEASGGQTGVNVDVAGFPLGGGDSPYSTTMLEGLPLYGSPYLSFMDNTSLIRMDDTVDRVEIVQGGPSAIFGPGQPGATENFILKTGSNQQAGSLGVTYGSEGMERVDVFESGKLATGWYGSIGGYYTQSDGVRNPQYLDTIGGQLTATLKHDLDNGSIVFWARTLHEHDQWVADFPYVESAGGSVSVYPGFNQLNSTYNSKQLENFQVPDPACNCFENDDISNGRGDQLSYIGSQLNEKFDGGWSISNDFIFDGGLVPTYALINNGNPQTLGSYIDSLTLPDPLTTDMVDASFTNGQAVNPNQSVVTQQVWDVQKKITSVIDEFRVNKDLGFGDTLTVGVYAAHYTMNDNWSLSSNVLITNQPNAAPIILTATSGGNTYQVSSPQGIVSANGGYYILQNGRATNIAPYISDSWKIDRWLLDAGLRVEHINLDQETTNSSPVQMGSMYDLWDNAVELPNGTWSHGYENNTIPTFSVGANYEFTDNMSAYVRVNNGVLFENMDDVRCNVYDGSNGCPNRTPLQTVRNYEGGFKIQNQFTYIDASVYRKTFKGIAYTPTNIDDVPIGPAGIYGSTSTGARLVGSVTPFATSDNQPLSTFKITVNGIWEDAYYTGFAGCYVYQNIQGATVCGTINGKQLARLPKFQVRVTPSDTQNFDWGTVTEQLTYERIGERYQDDTGLTPLPAYYDLGFGIDAMYGEHWELRLLGSNVTDQLGLTEGNARFGGNTVQNNVGFGRSILGHEYNVTLKYYW